MRTVEQALDSLSGVLPRAPRPVEDVALSASLGRVLARDVRMDVDVPPFRRATMDGFAIHAQDRHVGQRIAVVGAVHAGQWPDTALIAGQAQRVMTGAPVPEGTDAVVPFEWCADDGAQVTLDRVPAADTNFVVERGAHVREGDVVLREGVRIDPGTLGVLATAGCGTVPVRPTVRVGILSTGSELVEPSEQPGPGRIRNSNAYVLEGLVRRAGETPLLLGVAKDETGALRALVDEGLASCDVLLLSGGVSKGDADFVPDVLAEAGVTQVFHRWSVQPGGPLWCGHQGDTLVFGLPGNPAAVFVGFEILVVPILRALHGSPLVPRETQTATLAGDWGRPGTRRRFRPATLRSIDDGDPVVEVLPWLGSGDPFAWTGVNALAVFPEDAPISAQVQVIPLGGSLCG